MNHHVNAITGRLSLRPPQQKALKIFDGVTEIAPLWWLFLNQQSNTKNLLHLRYRLN